jgi:hypothetical protein
LSGFHTAKYDRGFAYADVEVSSMNRNHVLYTDLSRAPFVSVNYHRIVNMATPDGSHKRLI